MVARYIALPKAPKAAWDDDPLVADVTTRTVILEDDGPVKTGLLDANGTPLYRMPNRIPIGFVKG